MIFFTSDIHFSDAETMLNDNRPFKNVRKFDKHIIKIWNKLMNKNDTLYVVGDLLDCNDTTEPVWQNCLGYFKKIKAKIVLIIGNNEQRIIDRYFNKSFNKFKEMCLSYGIYDVKKNEKLSFGGYKFYLTHEPVNYKEGYVNLVGHLHRSRGQWYSFGINVSCDLNYFRPYSTDDILFQLKQKEKYYKNPNFSLL